MNLQYVPLLKMQRALYDAPPGPDRFHAYLRTMLDEDSGDLRFPLAVMNPMAGDHAAACLDAWIALDADLTAAMAVTQLQESAHALPGECRVGLVLADDLGGAWTNRYTTEFSQRFQHAPLYKRGWITCVLWTSEPPDLERLGREVRVSIHRAIIEHARGAAETLGEMLAQEGEAMALAEFPIHTFDPEEMARTAVRVNPLRETTDYGKAFACLFGDAAARELGIEPLGFAPNEALTLALYEART